MHYASRHHRGFGGQDTLSFEPGPAKRGSCSVQPPLLAKQHRRAPGLFDKALFSIKPCVLALIRVLSFNSLLIESPISFSFILLWINAGMSSQDLPGPSLPWLRASCLCHPALTPQHPMAPGSAQDPHYIPQLTGCPTCHGASVYCWQMLFSMPTSLMKEKALQQPDTRQI